MQPTSPLWPKRRKPRPGRKQGALVPRQAGILPRRESEGAARRFPASRRAEDRLRRRFSRLLHAYHRGEPSHWNGGRLSVPWGKLPERQLPVPVLPQPLLKVREYRSCVRHVVVPSSPSSFLRRGH